MSFSISTGMLHISIFLSSLQFPVRRVLRIFALHAQEQSPYPVTERVNHQKDDVHRAPVYVGHPPWRAEVVYMEQLPQRGGVQSPVVDKVVVRIVYRLQLHSQQPRDKPLVSG